MEIVATLNRAKYDAFKWRYELSLPWKLVLALGMAALTGLLAQVRVPLPWSPVPITGQTFAVLLAGVLLGRWWGGISLAFYAGLGRGWSPLVCRLGKWYWLPCRTYGGIYNRFYPRRPLPGVLYR